MHDYSLGFALPWWGILATALLAVGVSLWAYGRPAAPLLPRQRLQLGMLRAIALIALVAALWQPLVAILSTQEQPPRVAVLLDNSASMRLQDASGSREMQYRRALEHLRPLLNTPRALLLRFDASVQPLEQWHPDSLRLDGIATDFAHALRWVSTESRTHNLRAVLIVSDGVATAGGSPLPEAEATALPIIGVLVGDTTPQRDAAVENLLANERIPLGSQSQVYASIRAEDLGGHTAQIEFWEDGQRRASTTLALRPDQRLYTVRFPYKPQTEGVHRLRVRVAPLPGERSVRNNEARTFVNVVRLQRRVVLFAGSPSPDLAFLRRELQRNPLLQLSTFVQKEASGSFYEGTPTASSLQQADAVLLLDFPTRSTPEPLVRALAEIVSRGCPIAWFAGPLTDMGKLRALESGLPISPMAATASREFTASVMLTPTGASHPLLRLPEGMSVESWHQLPPVFAFRNLAQPKPSAEVLAIAHAGTVREPFLVAQQQSPRSVAVLGYGLYRWKLMGHSTASPGDSAGDHLASFATHLIEWLLATPREPLVQIRTTKRLYRLGEPVEFWASVSDPLGNPVDNATVHLRITADGGARHELVLSPSGHGIYQGALSELPAGEYTVTGEALLRGERLGTDHGHFGIGDIGLEERSLRADAELLRLLAERTGGALFGADSAARAWEFIQRLPGFRPVVTTVRREIALWHSPWLLVLALTALSAEWILRRRWGLP